MDAEVCALVPLCQYPSLPKRGEVLIIHCTGFRAYDCHEGAFNDSMSKNVSLESRMSKLVLVLTIDITSLQNQEK